jgi:DcuC family C4-dicarboxylate transporter
MAGTWGSVYSPGATHNPFVAKLANVDVMTVIAGLSSAAFAGIIAVAICLTIVAYLRKEHQGYHSPTEIKAEENFNVNYIMATVPLVPLALLILGSKQVHLLPEVSVPQAMLAGVFLSFLVTRVNPQEISKQFFVGMGDGYAGVMGIIIAAATFTKGMELVGLTGSLINAMKGSESIAKIAATFGPFIIAVLSGSGDAATLAFNGAITPHAQQFGFGIIEMGSQAQIAGALGRSMSPVAGAAIVSASLAGVNTIEITRRNALGMLVAALVTMFVLL